LPTAALIRILFNGLSRAAKICETERGYIPLNRMWSSVGCCCEICMSSCTTFWCQCQYCSRPSKRPVCRI